MTVRRKIYESIGYSPMKNLVRESHSKYSARAQSSPARRVFAEASGPGVRAEALEESVPSKSGDFTTVRGSKSSLLIPKMVSSFWVYGGSADAEIFGGFMEHLVIVWRMASEKSYPTYGYALFHHSELCLLILLIPANGARLVIV
jgi:hypothetical protein